MDDDNRYRIPEGFNPFSCADKVLALADAVHHALGSIETPSPRHALASLQSLSGLLCNEIHQLHRYLREIENSTHLVLPLTNEGLDAIHVKHNRDEIRENPAPVYQLRPKSEKH